MQEQLGCPVGETYEGDLIYKFADGWGITSRRDILRFAEYNKSWQTPNRAVVLIDTGGRDSKDARIAIALSDLVLIPTTASQLDISVLDLMIERLREAKKVNSSLKALIVMNRVATNPFLTSKKDTLIEYIKDLIKDDLDYIKLANTIIYEREAFKVAIQMGRGVFELNKNSKASGEIQNLCKEISKAKGT